MNKKLYAGILALISALARPQVSAAADAGGDWVGQLTGPFDSEYTAQYNHVTLKTNSDQLRICHKINRTTRRNLGGWYSSIPRGICRARFGLRPCPDPRLSLL